MHRSPFRARKATEFQSDLRPCTTTEASKMENLNNEVSVFLGTLRSNGGSHNEGEEDHH